MLSAVYTCIASSAPNTRKKNNSSASCFRIFYFSPLDRAIVEKDACVKGAAVDGSRYVPGAQRDGGEVSPEGFGRVSTVEFIALTQLAVVVAAPAVGCDFFLG